MKAFTVSGDVVTAVELVIHGEKKHDSDGATCLFLNPRTLMLEWALFILLFYIGNIQTFVATSSSSFEAYSVLPNFVSF